MKPLVAAIAVLVALVLCVSVQAQTPEIDALRVRAEAQFNLGSCTTTAWASRKTTSRRCGGFG